jgi:hypothetical protein
MGEITTLTRATTGKESLRTTVPMSIIKHFKLKASDRLDWDFEARNNELVIVVRPFRNSSGNIAIDKQEQTNERKGRGLV